MYVELQKEVGEEVEKGEAYAIVESVKSSNDIFSPVSGTIVAFNEDLSDNPGAVNESAHGDGWICTIDVRRPRIPQSSCDTLYFLVMRLPTLG